MMRKSPISARLMSLSVSMPVALLLPMLVLSACAPANMASYPSLARRPIERSASVVPATPAAPAPPAPVSATLAEAIRALGSDADRGEAAFRAALPETQTQVAAGRGASVGSESWAVAQRALSRLDAVRGPTTLALAELDRLVVTQAETEALTAQQARVAALVAAQGSLVSGMADGLAQ